MAMTTLILGAGLGKAYGFPDGPELKSLVANNLEDHEGELKNILRWETAPTIDAIAKHHPQHARRIRRLVTKLIYERENEQKLNQDSPPNFYKLMLEQIRAIQENGDSAKIITFNYDRSLHFLIHNVNQINKTPTRQLDPNSIHSVYGRLAPLRFEEPENQQRPMGYHEYGAGLSDLDDSIHRVRFFSSDDDDDDYDQKQNYREAARLANVEQKFNELCNASKISFIGEMSEHDHTLTKTWLESSDQIFLLGIGYHRENMKVLGFDFEAPHPDKVIAGTGYSLSSDTIAGLLEQYPAIQTIQPCDAHTFLWSKFNISEPAKNRAKLRSRIQE